MSLKQNVLMILKNRVLAATVEVGNQAKITGGFEYEIEGLEGLAAVIEDATKKLKTDKFMAVIGDELCVLAETEVEAIDDLAKANFFELITQKTEDKLGEKDWDYKVIGESEGKKKVMIFALDMDLKRQLVDIAGANNLWIQSIEPVSLAKTRNEDPIIGICLEEKKEEAVEAETVKETKKEVVVGNEPNKKMMVVPMIIGAILLLGGGVWFGVDRITSGKQMAAEDKLAENITPTPIVEPTATPMPVEKPETWQILNGSGVTGLAKKWADDLTELGYEDIKTGNADNSDYEATEVTVRKDSMSKQVEEDLADKGVSAGNISIDEDLEYDVVVIIGKE